MSSGGICSGCGSKIIGTAYQHEGQSYCYRCYERLMGQLKEQESQKNELYEYIRDLYSIQECPETVVRAVEKALLGGKKVSGIQATLFYHHKINGAPTDNLNLISWVIDTQYEPAKKYFKEQKEIQERNATVDITPPSVTVKVDLRRKKKKWVPEVNMEDL